MIKYRQLYFWIAAAIATASVGLAQTTPGRPAAIPADSPPASKAAKPATPPPKAATEPAVTTPKSGTELPFSAPAVRLLTTLRKKATATQKPVPAAGSTEPGRRIAIIELTPDTQQSEVIRQVIEILEKQGVAKQSTPDAATTTSPGDITARIAARADTKSEDVLSLVKSLQGHGVVRMSFVKPSNNRNIVTVVAPANTPWPVIKNIRTMVNAKKQFSVDVQIAAQAQHPKPVKNGGYNSGSSSRYDYPAGSRYASPATGETTSKGRSSRTTVRMIGQNGQPVSRVEKSVGSIQAVLRNGDSITVMIGAHNLRFPVSMTTDVASAARTIVKAIEVSPDITLWNDGDGLLIRTPQDEFSNPNPGIGRAIAQSILDVLSGDQPSHPGAVSPVDANLTATPDATVGNRPQPVQKTRIFMLRYADASVIAEGISQLFDKGFGIAPDVRTNSVIVRGAPSQVGEMEVLVAMLDRPQPKRLSERPVGATDSKVRVERHDQGDKAYSVFYVDVPPTVASQARIQIQNLDRLTKQTAESLRTSEAGSNESSEFDKKRKAELREVVRKTFLARQELQRAELAEFAARLKRIQQSIEMRDTIADKIIDRRVEELLDPNLNWDQNVAAGTQKTVVRTQSVIQQQNQGQRVQPAPKQNTAAVGTQPVEVTRPSASTVILRNAGEFRELLRTHARNVGLVHQQIKSFKARAENAVGPEEIANAKAFIEAGEKTLPLVEAERNFVLREYQTQIQLLESEVETVHLMVKTAEQELDRTKALVDAGVVQSHKLDQHKRELAAALQRLERATVLLDLYQEAGEGA